MGKCQNFQASILVFYSLSLTACVVGGTPNSDTIEALITTAALSASTSSLSATITQGSGQAATVATLPITFSITFNKSVTGFDSTDLTFNGGTPGLTYSVSGSGSSYTLSVTAVDHARKIIPTINAFAATSSDSLTNAVAITASASQAVNYIPLKFKNIYAGGSARFSCGITAEGIIYCWGKNDVGQLGIGSSGADQPYPVAIDTSDVTGEKTFKQLTLGSYHACAITTQGVAYCWGDDAPFATPYGALGNGALPSANKPSPVDTTTIAGDKTFVQISAGALSTCVVMGDGAAYCWGREISGELGNGAGVTGNQVSPTLVDTSTITGEKAFIQIGMGSMHACGLTSEGVAYCWGDDASGLQIGNGATTGTQHTPAAVDTSGIAGEKTFIQLSVGGFSTCGLTGEGISYCWGSNLTYGNLGVGNTVHQNKPLIMNTTVMTGEKVFSQISMTSASSCGVTTDGIGHCWGWFSNGRLGDGLLASANVNKPTTIDLSTISGDSKMSQINSGYDHSCGLTANGTAYCWGQGSYYALGTGTSVSQGSPTRVQTQALTSEASFTQVVSGSSHSCGLTQEGIAYCWGSDSNGQLGNGATTGDQVRPSLVDTSLMSGSKFFKQLTAGTNHTCGIMLDSIVYCWGSDSSGQLGNGATAGDQVSPSLVDRTGIAGNKSFLKISAKGSNTCGITTDGKVHCWGSDSNGQLGNGATAGDQVSPSLVDTTTVAGTKSFKQISVGNLQACGITIAGVAYCWGSDNDGRLGNGATAGDQISPSAVNTTPITGKKAFIQISTNNTQTCGITSELIPYCWGSDTSGQLGNGSGTTGDQISPTAVDIAAITSTNKSMTQIAVGASHVCGLASDGLIYCWGDDASGQIGNGASIISNQVSPTLINTADISGDKGFINLSSDSTHSCAVTGKGGVYYWGSLAGFESPTALDVSQIH